MKNLTPELIAKAKAARSAEELLVLAKENSVELTEAEAKTYFEQLNANGAVSDDELDAVAGGSFLGISCTGDEEDDTNVLKYEGSAVTGICPKCACTEIIVYTSPSTGEKSYICRKCSTNVPNAKKVRAL